MSIVRNIAGIAKGMSITFREMLEPTQVENYPDGPGPLRGAVLEQRFRGAHVLQRDENGLEKCVACFLCAAACPANCIYIEAAENTEEQRILLVGALRQGLQHRLQPLHLLRLLRGGLPHRRHHARARLRAGHAERHQPGDAQGRYAGAGERADGGEVRVQNFLCCLSFRRSARLTIVI